MCPGMSADDYLFDRRDFESLEIGIKKSLVNFIEANEMLAQERQGCTCIGESVCRQCRDRAANIAFADETNTSISTVETMGEVEEEMGELERRN